MAGQIELFGLSKREIERKFTRSEIALLAWRSQEIAVALEKSAGMGGDAPQRRKAVNAQVPDGLPDRFFNEKGEVDLSKVTGEDAWQYMSAQGIKLPVFGGGR